MAVIASAAGSGKTTVGRKIAERLGLPFVELDALHWGAGWSEASPAELRSRVEPIVATHAWVIDGAYRGKLGDLVLARADLVVWLDLPLRSWLPRLVRRTVQRVWRGEELWGGNRETLSSVFLSRDSLLPFALRTYWRRRRDYPHALAEYRVVRLRSSAKVERFLRDL